MVRSISTIGRSVRDLMAAIRDPGVRIFRVGMGEHAGEERISRQGSSPLKGLKVEEFESRLGNRVVKGKYAKHKGEKLGAVMAAANRAAKAIAKKQDGVFGSVLVVADGVPMIWSEASLAMYTEGTSRKYGTITETYRGRHRELLRIKRDLEYGLGIAPEVAALA